MRVTIDRINLPADTPAGWTFTPGANANTRHFEMPIKTAERLLKQARRHRSELVIEAPELGIQPLKIRGLTILGVAPTPRHPEMVALVVADRRWVWTYPHYNKNFNVRRKTGAVRRVGNQRINPKAIQKLAQDVQYRKSSLNPYTKKAWEPADAIRHVMNFLEPTGAWYDDRVLNGKVKLPPIEELYIDDKGHMAISRLLNYLGSSLDVVPVPDGRIKLFSRVNNDEFTEVGLPASNATNTGKIYATLDGMREAVSGRPLFIQQDRRMERPSKIRVLFEVLPEIRFEFKESARTNQTVERNQRAAPPTLRNVTTAKEDFTVSGRDYITGMPIEIAEGGDFITRFNQIKNLGPASALPNMSLNIARRRWERSQLEKYASLDPSRRLSRWVKSLRSDYRQRFQVESPWKERLREILNERAVIEDIETRSRAKAAVFLDYAEKLAWIEGAGGKINRAVLDKVWHNVTANPASVGSGGNINGTDYTKLRGASVDLNVDSDLAIMSLSFQLDKQTNEAYDIRPCGINRARNPSDFRDDKFLHLSAVKLEDDHEVSIITAVRLATPNDYRRYWVVEYDHRDVADLMPSKISPRGDGPVYEIRISPQRLVGYIPWVDANKDAFYRLFDDLDEPPPTKRIDQPLAAIGPPSNLDVLEEFGKAAAAGIYAYYLNHLEGGLTTGLDPTMQVSGIISRLTMACSNIYGAYAEVEMPDNPPRQDLEVFLPDAVRRVVDGFAVR